MTDEECDAFLGQLFGTDAVEQPETVHPKATEIKKRARQAVRELVTA
jgi:hypothetical protein